MPYNPYARFKEDNAQLFRGAYERKTPKTSYDEAASRIAKIKDKDTRDKAMQLLIGGLRLGESATIQSGYCVGKGNKRRRVYVGEVAYPKSESTFRRQLKKETGLTPHMLRKIKATEVAKKARPEQLCELFGWSSFDTARSYIDAGSQPELEELMQGGTKE